MFGNYEPDKLKFLIEFLILMLMLGLGGAIELELVPSVALLVKLPQCCTIKLIELIVIRVSSHNKDVPDEFIWTLLLAVTAGSGYRLVRMLMLCLILFLEAPSYLFSVMKCLKVFFCGRNCY